MINTVDLESIKKIITDSSYYTMMSNPATFVSSLSKLKKLNMDLVIIYNNFSIDYLRNLLLSWRVQSKGHGLNTILSGSNR